MMNRREFLKHILAMIGSMHLALQDNPILSIPKKIKALSWSPLRGSQQDIDYYHFIIAEAEDATGEIISRNAFLNFDEDKTLEFYHNLMVLSSGVDVNDLR